MVRATSCCVRGERGAECRNLKCIVRKVENERIVRNELFFFSSRRRHTRSSTVSWARRCGIRDRLYTERLKEYLGS